MPKIRPEDSDPLLRLDPEKTELKELARHQIPDVIALLRQLIIRVEQLEKDMHEVKKKLNLK